MCTVIWSSLWGQRACRNHGLTSTSVKKVPDASWHEIIGQSLSFHRSRASSSGNSVLSLPDFARKCVATGLMESSGTPCWVDIALGTSAVVGGTVPLWIPAGLHIKASPVFSSVQENIWKICPVNSPLCSCLDFNIYLPIRSNIWWMPMGKKIRHYEKQKALFPSPFSFLSKQIHKYEKKS